MSEPFTPSVPAAPPEPAAPAERAAPLVPAGPLASAPPATHWWIKVKPPGPGADYRWLRLAPETGAQPGVAPVAPPAPPGNRPPATVLETAAEAAEVGGTGELTVVLLVRPDGAPALYVEGLRGASWPCDHQGRAITASLVGLAAADAAGGGEPLARALWAITRPTAARQAALDRVVRFDPQHPGSMTVDPAVWRRFLRTAGRLPAPHPVEPGGSRRGSDETALTEAVRDVLSVLSAGLGTGAGAPPGWLLAVSPLLDHEWCGRRRPWRAVGPALGRPPDTLPGASADLSRALLPVDAPGPAGARPVSRAGGLALPGRAEAARLVRSVFSLLALAALCTAVLLVVL